MSLNNTQVARLLREVASALTIKKGNLFKIRAYETAADAIEHSTAEIKDLWEEGQLDQVPGLGKSLQAHLEELFKTGKVKHWGEVKKGIPSQTFAFLDISGVGPKTAVELSKLGVKSVDDLKDKIKSGELVKKGFSIKIAEKIMQGITELESFKSGRLLLPIAFAQAQKILDYLKKNKNVKKADALGSLRRMVATVGDLDFAVSSEKGEEVVKYIARMPGVARVIEAGPSKISVKLSSGIQLDFLIAVPHSYGALLQHFTGSKLHNIHLRTLAESMGYSLSEYGVKRIKNKSVIKCETEEELYGLLGMQTPAPETREDTGEIDAALNHKLPKLVTIKDIKGDLHTHSNFPLHPSHGPGVDSLEETAKKGKELGYEYLGIADHPPSAGNHTTEEIIKLIIERKKVIEYINSSDDDFRVLNLLEVDIQPDGNLSVPDEGLKMLDFALAGIHSVHRQPKEQMTKRILKALENPYVKALTHPTGRLLNKRGSYEADWEMIFKFAAKNKKVMEVNAYPNRLDLSENLIRMAKSMGVKFIIDTDAHSADGLENMFFGMAMARRGWLESSDVINAWEWTKFKKWFNI